MRLPGGRPIWLAEVWTRGGRVELVAHRVGRRDVARGPLVRHGLTGRCVRWLRGKREMGVRDMPEGNPDDQDSNRGDDQSRADQDQISTLERPLLLGCSLALRLSQLFEVVSFSGHATRPGSRASPNTISC